jgi:hypothetical protein
VPNSSRKLFLAWAAKRRQVIDLEDQVAASDGAASAATSELTGELQRTRAEAETVLQQALETFHMEMRERGLE